MPLIVVALAPVGLSIPRVWVGFLGFLGALAAYVGNANVFTSTMRVTFWSALAMAVTAGIRAVFGTVLSG